MFSSTMLFWFMAEMWRPSFQTTDPPVDSALHLRLRTSVLELPVEVGPARIAPLGDPPARQPSHPQKCGDQSSSIIWGIPKKCQTELDGIWMNLAILPWNPGTLFRIGLMKAAILPLGSLKYIRVTTSQIPNNLHLFITVYLFTFNHHVLLTFADLYGHQLSSWGWYQQPSATPATRGWRVLLAETWPIQSRNGVQVTDILGICDSCEGHGNMTNLFQRLANWPFLTSLGVDLN